MQIIRNGVIKYIVLTFALLIFLGCQKPAFADPGDIVCVPVGGDKYNSNGLTVTNHASSNVSIWIQENICNYQGTAECRTMTKRYNDTLTPGQTKTYRSCVRDHSTGQIDINTIDDGSRPATSIPGGGCYLSHHGTKWDGGLAFAIKPNNTSSNLNCPFADCNPSALNMTYSPDPGTNGQSISFRTSGSQGDLWITEGFTGGVANCSGNTWLNTFSCTANSAGNFTWTHRWKNCEANNTNFCSNECSKSQTFSIDPLPQKIDTTCTGGSVGSQVISGNNITYTAGNTNLATKNTGYIFNNLGFPVTNCNNSNSCTLTPNLSQGTSIWFVTHPYFTTGGTNYYCRWDNSWSSTPPNPASTCNNQCEKKVDIVPQTPSLSCSADVGNCNCTSDTTPTWSWAAVTGADDYSVYRSWPDIAQNCRSISVCSYSSSGTNYFTPSSVSGGTGTHTVRVYSINSAGVISNTGATSTVTLDQTPPQPNPPGSLSCTRTGQNSTTGECTYLCSWSSSFNSGSDSSCNKNYQYNFVATDGNDNALWDRPYDSQTSTNVTNIYPGDVRKAKVRGRDGLGNVGSFSSSVSLSACPTLVTSTNTPTPPSATPTINPCASDTTAPTSPSPLTSSNCTNWSWTQSSDNCAFSHYWLQCADNSSFSGGTWYHNSTIANPATTNVTLSSPAPPAGSTVYCRIRAEDDAGNYLAWTTGQRTCAVSPTPTATRTPTPSPTIIPGCTDSSPPPAPTSNNNNLTCTYDSTVSGTSYYTVTYSWNPVNDVGCAGMHTYPYWSQISTSSSYSTVPDWYNSWAAATTRTSDPDSGGSFTEGTRVYAHVRARDAFDNQSAWSTNAWIDVGTTTCSGTPTVTPTRTPTPTTVTTATPTMTPTPTPAYWYKFNNTSFHKYGSLSNHIPNPINAYDSTLDDTDQRYLIINEGGIVSSDGTIDIGSDSSIKNWKIPGYSRNQSLTPRIFIDYIRSRKEYITIKNLNEIQSNKINIIDGNQNVNDDIFNENKDNFVLIVQGSITIKDNFNSNDPAKAVALISTDTINIAHNVSSINGIIIANHIDFSYDQAISNTALKIKGNVVGSTESITNKRRRADSSRPSILTIMDPTYYLKLIKYLSIEKYEWKQIQ